MVRLDRAIILWRTILRVLIRRMKVSRGNRPLVLLRILLKDSKWDLERWYPIANGFNDSFTPMRRARFGTTSNSGHCFKLLSTSVGIYRLFQIGLHTDLKNRQANRDGEDPNFTSSDGSISPTAEIRSTEYCNSSISKRQFQNNSTISLHWPIPTLCLP